MASRRTFGRSMRLHTASEVISLLRLRENETGEYYEQLGKSAPGYGTILKSLAQENRANVVAVQRAYNNVISDALEGGYAFDMDSRDLDLSIPKSDSLSGAIEAAVAMETAMIRVYSIGADQSRALLPDVSRAMSLIASKRQARIQKLRALGQTPV